jgi:hypothetical protein
LWDCGPHACQAKKPDFQQLQAQAGGDIFSEVVEEEEAEPRALGEVWNEEDEVSRAIVGRSCRVFTKDGVGDSGDVESVLGQSR